MKQVSINPNYKWLVAMQLEIELYWAHLIYVIVWFWKWLISILGGAFGKQYGRKFQWLELMA
jgi:hypothetical protein